MLGLWLVSECLDILEDDGLEVVAVELDDVRCLFLDPGLDFIERAFLLSDDVDLTAEGDAYECCCECTFHGLWI